MRQPWSDCIGFTPKIKNLFDFFAEGLMISISLLRRMVVYS